jgi:RNA-binding protein
VVKQLEQATGLPVVGLIGRTVIVYRPSLIKLKAEQKKKAFVRKLKPTLPVKQRKTKKFLLLCTKLGLPDC